MRNEGILILLVLLITTIGCQATKPSPSYSPPVQADEIVAFTSGMQRFEGYFNFSYDEAVGRVFLEVDKLDQEFLYVTSLAAGVGSNDIGLDRGQLGNSLVVKFEKHGNKLLLIQPNYGYRAISNNPDEIKSVSEAFALSVIGAFDVLSRNSSSYLIDITDFLLRDSHKISGRLSSTNQGSYSLDPNRSVVYMKETFNFPENTEFESLLTFSGSPSGDWIRSVTPSPEAITVRTHHSLIKLPDDNYTPRVFDPRSGFSAISYQDYATPIEEPLVKKFIVRHRLKKKDPSAEMSEPEEPIIYYVDRGAPEPIRSALIEGASWWNQAFEAAGYKNAFQVKLLPEGVHPLDIRYNVIQWIHRSTRGWSYGTGVVDPRTGEMIKGHVSLGSLRVRQDFLIATGLLQPYENGDEQPSVMTELALARLRQLSAHEVGHTIGLVHNFSASTNDRASVMDYPHPYIKLTNGEIDLSEAYDDKIGDWDKVSIKYGYSDFGPENREKLNQILSGAFQSGLKYITDQDARPTGGLNADAHLWDNGEKAEEELNRLMKIRRKVLDDFSEKVIRNGRPMSSLEEVLVPMYLLHRYQVDATSKIIGGLSYSYSLRGEKANNPTLISQERQLDALDALINTIKPENLLLSEKLIESIPPRAFGYPRSRETFQSRTGPAFDYMAAVETAASIPFRFLFNPDRANRLLTYKSRQPNDQPGFQRVLDQIINAVWKSPSSNTLERSIQEVVEMEMLNHLMMLAANDRAYDKVKAISYEGIRSIRKYAKGRISRRTNSDGVYYQYVINRIDEFFKNPDSYKVKNPIKAPDGSPIGSCDF